MQNWQVSFLCWCVVYSWNFNPSLSTTEIMFFTVLMQLHNLCTIIWLNIIFACKYLSLKFSHISNQPLQSQTHNLLVYPRCTCDFQGSRVFLQKERLAPFPCMSQKARNQVAADCTAMLTAKLTRRNMRMASPPMARMYCQYTDHDTLVLFSSLDSTRSSISTGQKYCAKSVNSEKPIC